MKRKSLLFLLLIALLAPWAAYAQETLTVHEGTATSNNVPVHGLWADAYLKCEMVYPATELSDMEDGTISKLTFYASSPAAAAWSGTFQVFISEVSETTISAFAGPGTVVYEGTLNGTQSSMDIEFTTPYTYGGGNLLVGVYQTVKGSYSGITWTGETVNGASGQGYSSSSLNGITFAQKNFLPKTTFTYQPAATSCEKPATCEVSDVTSTSATLTWSGGSGTYNVEVKGGSDWADWTEILHETTLTTTTLTLQPNTSYQARVQSVCTGSTPTSGWKTSASFTTPCDPYDIPYTYGFEEAAPFDCWTAITGNVTVKSSTSNSHNSSYYLDFRGTNSNMIALPQFNEATNNLRVEFWTRPESTGGNSGKFAVGYMTDITDASTFVAVITYNSTEMTTTYVKKIVDFVDAPAGANIAMRQFDCSTNYYWYVDDVTVKEIPNCVAPTGLAADATTNSAELSWTVNSNETDWTVYYKKTTDANYTEVANATNPYTLSGLDAATIYQYYVVANCSADEASEPSEVFTFATECEAISTYPWTENFDSYTGVTGGTTNNLPICWNYINTCTYNSYKGYPVIYNASGYSHSGNNHLRFYTYAYYNSSGTTTYDPQDQYAILPEMEDLNGKQLSLYARGVNANSSFKVGLMTDPTDVSTFVEIATTTPTTSYEEYLYILTGRGNYIAIMIEAANSSATSRSVYIDDITIAEPPACPKPLDLTVVANSVTTHTAQLSWASDADAWQIMLNNDTLNLIDVTTNPYVLENLPDGMQYTVTVRANCGNDGYSEWSDNATFNTPIACPAPTGLAVSNITGHTAELNWNGSSDGYIVSYRAAASAVGIYEEFNKSGVPFGWTKYQGLVDYVLNDSIQLTTGGGWTTTTYALGEYNMKLNIFGTGCKAWLVTPEFTLDQNLSFDLALTDYGNADPIENDTLQADDRFIVLIYANNAWTILREWNNTGSEYVYNAISATGENVTIDLSTYYGQNVKLAFYGESTVTSNGDNDLHIDNVFCGTPIPASEWMTATTDTTTYTITGLDPEVVYEVKVASDCPGETGHETAIVSFITNVACMTPSGLAAAEITPYGFELSWVENGEATAWQIQLNEEDPIDVTTNPYTLDNLESDSLYVVKVRANCGDEGYSEWSTSISVTTLEACPTPEDLAVSDITSNSATVTWTGFSDNYIVSYRETAEIFYTEGFEDGEMPAGWTVEGDTQNATKTWRIGVGDNSTSTGTHSGNYNALITHDTKTNETYLITPAVDLSNQSGLMLSFWYINRSWAGDIDEFGVYYRVDGGDWNELWSTTDAHGTWTNQTVALTGMANNYQIGFKMTDNYGYGVGLDDIELFRELSGNWQTVEADESPASLTELTASTKYEVKVQGICDGEPTEETEIVTFTTLEQTTVTQTIALVAGVNWISVNVETDLDALKAALVATGNAPITIQSKDNGLTTYNGTRWRGTLNTLDVNQMYMVTVDAACEITLEGMPINPEEHPITIHNGANWIAFPLAQSMALSNAFAGFNAASGDVVNSKNSGLSTYNGTRWRGQLTTLVPGEGYIYNSTAAEDKTLVFPSSASKAATVK